MKIKLQEMRKRAGFKSAKAYADHMGYSPSTYTHYEQGSANIPFFDKLGRAKDALRQQKKAHHYGTPLHGNIYLFSRGVIPP